MRSSRPEVRNPLLTLPAVARLRELGPHTRARLAELLSEISQDAAAKAEHCWRKHKAPMAAYWKAVAVYAKHTRRALEVRP